MNTRKQILKNSAWGNLNIFVRYGLSFLATALIASHYGPADFGIYQLAFTYLGILDAINFLNSTHLRNHFINKPQDEEYLISAWVLHYFSLWAVITVGLAIAWFSSDEKLLFTLLLISSVRLLFKVFEFPQVIFDSRMRNDLVQKVQIVSFGSFNIIRIIFSSLQASLAVLTSAAIFQGIISAVYQVKKLRSADFNPKFSYKKGFCLQLMKDSFPLAVMWFLSNFQSRIMGVLLADRMTPVEYGSFQLVFKLVEPATAIGLVIFSSNYTTLAHTLKTDEVIFKTRFKKISLLALFSSFVFSFLLVAVPTDLLVKIFGAAYREGLELLWMGVGVVLSATIFAISVQYDMLVFRYRSTLLKYFSVVGLYFVGVWWLDGNISVKEGILFYSIAPLVVAVLWHVFPALKKTN